MNELLKTLKQKGVLKSEWLAEALRKVDRKDFVPEHLKDLAYIDEALPIGEDQTISQPYTVVFMLELLAPKKGDKVMEVGYGSGWQTALLAEIVGENGMVYSIERVPNLCDFGKSNVAKYPKLEKKVKFYCQDASLGLPDEARIIGGFDGIIAAAEVRDVPMTWREQLKVGGKLVYPRARSIFKEIKKTKNSFDVEEYPGFTFVPFVENN